MDENRELVESDNCCHSKMLPCTFNYMNIWFQNVKDKTPRHVYGIRDFFALQTYNELYSPSGF